MKKAKIHLGRKSSPNEIKPSGPKDSPKEFFPSFHVSGVKELHDLPDGKFHFKGTGKVVSKTHSTRDGQDNYSHEIEVHSIEPHGSAEEEPESESDAGLEAELTKIESKKSKK